MAWAAAMNCSTRAGGSAAAWPIKTVSPGRRYRVRSSSATSYLLGAPGLEEPAHRRARSPARPGDRAGVRLTSWRGSRRWPASAGTGPAAPGCRTPAAACDRLFLGAQHQGFAFLSGPAGRWRLTVAVSDGSAPSAPTVISAGPPTLISRVGRNANRVRAGSSHLLDQVERAARREARALAPEQHGAHLGVGVELARRSTSRWTLGWRSVASSPAGLPGPTSPWAWARSGSVSAPQR